MYEVSQKQHFIFRSNKLLENIGASHIIREITSDPLKLFENELVKQYVHDTTALPEPSYRIVGGGNATFIFDDEETATTFCRTLSNNILRAFPAIELFLVKETCQWDKEQLYNENGITGIINKLRDRLAEKKNERKYAVAQQSWGIQQQCVTSGLPANTYIRDLDTNEQEPRAEEFRLIRALGRDTQMDAYIERFLTTNDELSNEREYRFFEQADLEEIFGTDRRSDGSKSYLAIVSLDGNAMGVKVGKFFQQNFSGNDHFIEKYTEFTEDIDRAYTKAFQQTIAYLMQQYDVWAEEFYGDEFVKERWKKVIPIRPVIASGDDVSFITYGKLGIEIAKTFLQKLQRMKMTIADETFRFEACAGVAIIGHRYPFWLGFQLADQLCDHAKERLKQDEEKWNAVGMKTNGQAYNTSLIDWQLVTHSGMTNDINTYRHTAYVADDGTNLTMRPYYIQRESEQKVHVASYEDTFKRWALKRVQKSKRNDENERKNNHIPSLAKWKSLRDLYHESEQAVKQWQILNQFSPSGRPDTKDALFDRYENGFGLLNETQQESGERFATYYDAIEIIDYFIDLSGRDTE